MYSPDISGTSFSETFAVRFIPPNITAPAHTVSASPAIHAGTPNPDSSASAAEFICTMFPIPKDASTQAPANTAASGFAARLVRLRSARPYLM